MERHVVLLIGGPCDGMRHEVFIGQERLVVVPRTKARLLTDIGRDAVTTKHVEAVYRRVPFRSENGLKVDVYVHGDSDALALLISGYRQYSDPDPL